MACRGRLGRGRRGRAEKRGWGRAVRKRLEQWSGFLRKYIHFNKFISNLCM
jgi:hypothetical protein